MAIRGTGIVDLDVSLALLRYSVVAEGVDDVEDVGVVDAEAVGVAKLDHLVLADVEAVVVLSMLEVMVLRIDVLAFARTCGGTATGCRT